jgi:hypothetical protein
VKPFTLLIAYDVVELVVALPRREQLTSRGRFLRIRKLLCSILITSSSIQQAGELKFLFVADLR